MVQPAKAIVYELLTAPTAEDWAAIEMILEQSFLPEDLDPLADLIAWVSGGTSRLMVARCPRQGGRVVGVGMLDRLETWPGYHLGYLAVAPELRGLGVGEGLFQYLAEYVRTTGAQAMIWEVHPPDLADQASIDSRRVRFYERLGGRLLPGSEAYVLPSMIGPEYFPYRLMWLTADPATPDPDPAALAELVRAVYQREYPDHLPMAEQIAAAILGQAADAAP